jgi:hypothetical protein
MGIEHPMRNGNIRNADLDRPLGAAPWNQASAFRMLDIIAYENRL